MKVAWAAASIIPGIHELIKNIIGNIGSKKRHTVSKCRVKQKLVLLLQPMSSGKSMDIHFCSIDQSDMLYFFNVLANQHYKEKRNHQRSGAEELLTVTTNVASKKMNRNEISICVKAGLYVLN